MRLIREYATKDTQLIGGYITKGYATKGYIIN
jgi:hypothetical protein